MRISEVTRTTKETKISLTLNLDGSGEDHIDSGCGFLNHMLVLLTIHGRFDLDLKCMGDTHIDDHHTVEDIGIALGTAFREAIGDKRGIVRYGDKMLAMDETLMLCALDVSGRPYLNYDVKIPTQKVGNFDTELVKEFMLAFSRQFGLTLHFKMIEGENSHHIIEAMFKGLGRALKDAVAIDAQYADEIPSSKGIL